MGYMGPRSSQMGAMWAVRKEIERESEHEDVCFTWELRETAGTESLSAHCRRCDKTWEVYNHAILPSYDWIRHTLVDLGATVMRAECLSVRGRQMTQDLVVSWLIDAGAPGLPWSRILGKLLLLDLEDYSEAGDIVKAVAALELETWEDDGVAMIRLPEGHPDRGWDPV